MTPSGEQTEIRLGDQRAVVVEVGGGVRRYDVGGNAVLDGYDRTQMVTGARGQPLVPWPNRLHGGRYTWDGTEHVVPLDEPDQANALHGLTRWRSWTATDVTDSAATMRLRLLPQPAYPFALDLAVRYALDAEGLTVTTRAANVGDSDAPYGHGAHPYLTVGTELVDEAVLHLPAATWLPTGPAQIPLGRESVDGTPYDFRTRRPIGRVRVDHAFTDLDRDGRGRAVVALSHATNSRWAALWVDEHYPYVEVFTGDALPEPDRRRRGLGLEPMTCPPDAFRSGEDVIRLAPGDVVETSWGVTSGTEPPHL
jgi:aldose 1-epimerase